MGPSTRDYIQLDDEAEAEEHARSPGHAAAVAVAPVPVIATSYASPTAPGQPLAGQPLAPGQGFHQQFGQAFAFPTADPGGSGYPVPNWDLPQGVPMGRLWRGPVLNCTGAASCCLVRHSYQSKKCFFSCFYAAPGVPAAQPDKI